MSLTDKMPAEIGTDKTMKKKCSEGMERSIETDRQTNEIRINNDDGITHTHGESRRNGEARGVVREMYGE